jgi:hypothetical protein
MEIRDHILEQTLEYALWKTEEYKTLEEFKESIKQDLRNVHKKNMETLSKELNGN